jgi:replication factor C small subunit
MSDVMWVEKYRPKSLDEMVNQQSIISRLKAMVEKQGIPHLLFAGPPGTGKTATILAFAQDLYGEGYATNVLELNASDERGIDVVRNRIKNFARTRSLAEVPFKIIILDEADNMTSEAQHALRRTMELFVRTCRFCLICNYSNRVIPPIQSRCALFRFTPLDHDDVVKRLLYIADREGVTVTDEGIEAILELVNGDLRRAINTMQAAASLGSGVTHDAVYDVNGRVTPSGALDMVKRALKEDFVGARVILRELLIEKGFSGSEILRQVHRVLLDSQLKADWMARIIHVVGDTDYRIAVGADAEIQLSTLLAEIALIGAEMRDGY